MKEAVGVSLFVIGLTSLSGFTTFLLMTPTFPILDLGQIVVGSLAGMIVGTLVVRLIPNQLLQRGFSISVFTLALLTISDLLLNGDTFSQG